MKFSIITAIVFSLFTLSVNAQQYDHAHTEAATATKQSSLALVLPLYLDIKNALVSDNAALASSTADAFTKAVTAIDMNTVSASEMNAFMATQKRLVAEAGQVAATKDIKKQRDAFASLSASMIALAKGAKLSAQTVYVETCPMKKASWLSSEPAVKNPYYGKQMLTCGKVTESIN
ncbi:DUF3347 domain-containing protein [Flavisolibacter sp. BT320]|nr:DUF3347 domain-containing protein [Flavisolibacter longurius]